MPENWAKVPSLLPAQKCDRAFGLLPVVYVNCNHGCMRAFSPWLEDAVLEPAETEGLTFAWWYLLSLKRGIGERKRLQLIGFFGGVERRWGKDFFTPNLFFIHFVQMTLRPSEGRGFCSLLPSVSACCPWQCLSHYQLFAQSRCVTA